METNDLVRRLAEASHAYYNLGDPSMADSEFDELVDALRAQAPDHPYLSLVGAPPMGETFKHEIPVGSQEKLKTREEFDRWTAQVLAANTAEDPFTVAWKLDGLTVVLGYDNGVLVRALTRGDGKKGEDVTANVTRMGNVFRTLPGGFTGYLRGEILLPIGLFGEHFKPLGFANPRNTAAGKTRDQKAPTELLRHFVVQYFDIVPTKGYAFDTEWARGHAIMDMGLSHVITFKCATPDDVWAKYQAMEEERENLDIEVDGVIVRANDLSVQEAMGMSSDMRPKGQKCLKFEAMSASTRLNSVEVTIGHTGAIVPTGKLEPVGIGGVTVSSVFLNNWDEIDRLGVAIGDKVEVIRAGDVIPKITRVLEEAEDREIIAVPDGCPSCGTVLVKDGAHWFCRNEDCGGQEFRRLKNWVNKRDIKFLGDTLLQELFDNHGIVRADQLYYLTEEQLAVIPRGNGVVGTASKQIMAEITKSRHVTLNNFLGSLGIKFLGRRQVEIMMGQGIDTLDKWMGLSVEQLESMPGFSDGGSKAPGIVEGVEKAKVLIQALLDTGMTIEYPTQAKSASDGALSGKSICFSGSLPSGMKRAKAQAIAKAHGAQVASSVSKTLDYLVLADPTSTSNKANKARKMGVNLISEEQFLDIVNVKV